MEEQDLAIRCAKGDNEARRELYERYGARIYALCRRYVTNPDDAEDIKQDAFVKIFQVINRFSWTRPGSLYSWMSRVTINLLFDSREKRRRLTKQLVGIEDLEEDALEVPINEEAASVPPEVLTRMIDALPEGYRTVFKLYCIDGLSHRDIATLLGIKEKSSSASLSRARSLLAEAIRQYWKDQDNGSSTDGWMRILRKMRRASALRNSALVLALLVVSSLLLRQVTPHTSTVITQENTVSVGERYPADLNDSIVSLNKLVTMSEASCLLTERTRVLNPTQRGHQVLLGMDTSVDFKRLSDSIPSQPGDSQSPSTPDTDNSSKRSNSDSNPEIQPAAMDSFSISIEQINRFRPSISLSFRAGSGTTRRLTEVLLQSKPYIASLTYLNTVDPQVVPAVKSNRSNTVEFVNIAHSFLPPTAKNNYHHDLPISLGLTARMALTSRWGVESGIEYTYLHSSVESVAGNMDQQLHLIGIPLRMDVQLWSQDRFTLYAGLSAMAEKCVAASLGKISCEEKRILWSTGAFSGAQYQIGSRAYLYFQPQLSYSITNTDLITYRTENPFVFSLNAGLRFDL